MDFRELFRVLEKNSYYLFSFGDILTLFPEEKKSTLKKSIYRWAGRGWIAPLKKGLYELAYPHDFVIPDLYIANKLYHPSYVSLETALSNYSIIPEISMAVTSITTKPTRRFKNRHGLFLYRTVQPKAFAGYYVEKQGRYEFLIAEPEKAFVDYLYFKSYRRKKIDFKDERFDKDALNRLKLKKINSYARLYNLKNKELYAYL